MSGTYPGIDPFSPSAQPSGYGVWATLTVATGGDGRTAARHMTPVEGAQDNIQFLGWRMIDIVSGGTYAFTPKITISNAWDFKGTIRFITGNGGSVSFMNAAYVRSSSRLHVGVSSSDIGHLDVEDGSDITVKAGGALFVDGAAAAAYFQNGAALYVQPSANNSAFANNSIFGGSSGAGYVRCNGPLKRVGDLAREELRVKSLPMPGGTIDFSTADVWVVPSAMAAGHLATCDTSVAYDYEFTVVQGPSWAQGFDYWVCGVKFAALSSGNAGAARFTYRAGAVLWNTINAIVDSGASSSDVTPVAYRGP